MRKGDTFWSRVTRGDALKMRCVTPQVLQMQGFTKRVTHMTHFPQESHTRVRTRACKSHGMSCHMRHPSSPFVVSAVRICTYGDDTSVTHPSPMRHRSKAVVITRRAIRYLEGYDRRRWPPEQQPLQTEFVCAVRLADFAASGHVARRSPVSRTPATLAPTYHRAALRQHAPTSRPRCEAPTPPSGEPA